MKGDLTLVGGPGDGQVMSDIDVGVKSVHYCVGRAPVDQPVEIEESVMYQVVDFLEGPDRFCNARFAIPQGMTFFQGIALLAANYKPDQK